MDLSGVSAWFRVGTFFIMYTKNFGTRLKNGSFSSTVICKGNKVTLQKGRRMMKHQVIINVEKADGEKVPVVKGAIRYLPRKIVEWLFGEYTQVYLLKPGETVSSVDVVEVMED